VQDAKTRFVLTLSSGRRCGMRKNAFFEPFIYNMIFLPRQARDNIGNRGIELFSLCFLLSRACLGKPSLFCHEKNSSKRKTHCRFSAARRGTAAARAAGMVLFRALSCSARAWASCAPLLPPADSSTAVPGQGAHQSSVSSSGQRVTNAAAAAAEPRNVRAPAKSPKTAATTRC
jgi:hypothetical protein